MFKDIYMVSMMRADDIYGQTFRRKFDENWGQTQRQSYKDKTKKRLWSKLEDSTV